MEEQLKLLKRSIDNLNSLIEEIQSENNNADVTFKYRILLELKILRTNLINILNP